MCACYAARMFDVAQSLQPALREAQQHLDLASTAVARASANRNESTDRIMAQAAQAAIFEGALLSTMRSRIAEMKAVAKP